MPQGAGLAKSCCGLQVQLASVSGSTAQSAPVNDGPPQLLLKWRAKAISEPAVQPRACMFTTLNALKPNAGNGWGEAGMDLPAGGGSQAGAGVGERCGPLSGSSGRAAASVLALAACKG